jgi:PAS domain S-box-containing protein
MGARGTESVSGLAALRAENERLRALLAARAGDGGAPEGLEEALSRGPCLLAGVAADGAVRFANPALAALLGRDAAGLAGVAWTSLLAGEKDDAPRAALERAVARGEPATHDAPLAGPGAPSRLVSWTFVPARGAPAGEGVLVGFDVTERARDASAERRYDELLRRMVEGTTAVGRAFFDALVRELAGALGVKYALVAELPHPAARRARALAVCANGALAPPFEYDLDGTPCEAVMHGTPCFYRAGVTRLFPRDALLREMGVDSYIGVPLRGSDGTPLGILVVLHDGPIDETRRPIEVLQVFAGRAAAELERLRREEDVLRQRALAEKLFDALGFLVIVGDAEGRIVRFNPAAERCLGYREEEVRGRFFFEFLPPPELRESDLAAFQDIAAGSGPPEIEGQFLTRTGEVRHFVWNIVRAGDLGVAVGRDITAHRVADAAVRFASYGLKHSPDQAFWMGEDGRLVYVNESACASLGYSREELLGKHISAWVPSIKPGGWEARLATIRGLGQTTFESAHRRKDGSVFPVEITAACAEFEGKGYLCGFARDITKRRAAEEALRASEERFELAVRGSTDGLWDWNLSDDVVYYAERFEQLLGYERGELPPRFAMFPDHLHPEDRSRVLAALAAHLRDRGPYDVEYRLRTKSGAYRWYRARGQAVWEPGGEATRMAGSISDITDRRLAETALRESEELLSRMSRLARVGGVRTDFEADRGFWTDEVYRITEAPKDFIPRMEKTVEKFAPHTGRPLLDVFARLRREGGTYDLELEIVTLKGNRRWIHMQGEGFVEDGKVRSVVSAVQDVTERKQAEEARRAQDVRLRLLVEQTPAILWTVDRDLCLTSSTGAEHAALGLRPGEPLAGALGRDDAPGAAHRRALAGEAVSFEWERGERTFNAHVEPLREPDGRIGGAIGVALDITEKTRALRALAASERLFRTVCNQSPVGIGVFDRDGKRIFMNERWRAMTAGGNGGGEPCPWTDAVEEDRRAAIAAAAATLASERRPITAECRLRGEEGAVEARLNLVPLQDADGAFAGLLAMATDVGGVKQAEEDARLRRITSHVVGAVLECRVSPDGTARIEFASDGFEALAGPGWRDRSFDRAALLARVHEADRDRLAVLLEAGRARGEAGQVEARFEVAPGRFIWLQLQTSPGPHGPDRAHTWFAFITDVTARKAVEERLAELELRSKRILDVLPLPVLIFSPEGKIEYINEEQHARFGYRLDEMPATIDRWYEIAYPDPAYRAEALATTARAIASARASGAVPRVPGLRVRCKDGSECVVDLRYFEVGRQCISVCYDVTERERGALELSRRVAEVERLNNELAAVVRALEEARLAAERNAAELAGSNARLDAANQELEAFSYSVSHDLRAPLRHIDGFSAALLEDSGESLGEVGRGHLATIRASTRRMGKLIDDLLSLSRVTRSEMQMQEVDLSALCREIAADLARAAPERRVAWSIAPGVRARGDPALLRIAMQNLLGNAWKYTGKRAEAHIEFGAETEREERRCFVRDDGAGFDPRYASKLFDAFQRLHRASEFEGSGIGLATVRRILARHGGRIWANGRPGAGAAFYFTLPHLEVAP